ncbi:MAG: hypothetical protein VB064_14795 [Oscillospiraceae bacterium]|nr:hypothetical protein [Oscillospiraceae bacterium]
MTLSSLRAAKCRGLPVGREQVCGFCGSLYRVCMWHPHCNTARPAVLLYEASRRPRRRKSVIFPPPVRGTICGLCRGDEGTFWLRDGRVDGDGVFDTAAVPRNIVTTVTIDTPRMKPA